MWTENESKTKQPRWPECLDHEGVLCYLNFNIDLRQWGTYPNVNTICFRRRKCCWHFTWYLRPYEWVECDTGRGRGGWGERGEELKGRGMERGRLTVKCFQQRKMDQDFLLFASHVDVPLPFLLPSSKEWTSNKFSTLNDVLNFI